jgi:putative aldouronate transport system substrate-binding protein
MSRKLTRRQMLQLTGFTSAALALAACAPGAAPAQQGEGGAAAPSGEKRTVSISHIGGGSLEASEASPRMKLLRSSFPDVEIDNQWVSYAGYLEKIPLAVASGDIADLQFCNAFNDVPLMMEADILLATDDLLKSNGQHIVAATPEQAWESTIYDGKQYAAAHNIYDLNSWGTIYRGDWLEKLGLAVPTTTDEYAEAVRAFTKDDPDGNGAADTYGRLLYHTIRFDDDLFHAFGIAVGHHMNGFWQTRDGQVTLDWVQPQMKEALTWMRDLWAEGIFDPDSITIPLGQHLSKFEASIAGNGYASWTSVDGLVQRLQSVAPDAVVAPGPAIKGPNGDSGFTGEGWPWSYVISKNAPYPADAMNIVDWMFTPDIASQIVCDGVLGVTNKGLDDNNWCVEFTPQEQKDMGDKWIELTNSVQDQSVYGGVWSPIGQVDSLYNTFPPEMKAHFDEITKNKYSEMALQMRTFTQDGLRLTEKKKPVPADKDLWPAIQTRFGEFISQAVAGTIDMDSGWDEWIAYWEGNGGPTLTEQVNAG